VQEPAIRPIDTVASDALAILLVEDNAANRRIVELMINELGLRADVAANGLIAIEAARERHYDVILMDLQMPGVNGFEATRQIRVEQQRGARSTIIALTANVVEGEEARCRAAGMDGYLAKPLKLDSLASVLVPLASRRAHPLAEP
jgi:CheY-like chemotaxis protein